MRRPASKLVWFHAASVGEAQSTLILIDAIRRDYPEAAILVTTGTVTSASLVAKRLPPNAVHQYYPLDHPAWVSAFLDFWKPDLVLWMESELWPNMLTEIRRRCIPAALVNARLSPRSARRWRLIARDIRALLSTFSLCLAQSPGDAGQFRRLGAPPVTATDNLKNGAAPLPFDRAELARLQRAVGARPRWVYASSHDGEEELACRLHLSLRETLPDLLTVIVPRHPERRKAVEDTCGRYGLSARLRGAERALPQPEDDIYIADTLGELGLFYRLCPAACIGRSFSRDGGGGHNPIEAAQLGCAALHGPHVQNLAVIYRELDAADAALRLENETDFAQKLRALLSDDNLLAGLQDRGEAFCREKSGVTNAVTAALRPLLQRALTEARS
jgi:3-deoxy-D-manno-octulosonic-acid transferase